MGRFRHTRDGTRRRDRFARRRVQPKFGAAVVFECSWDTHPDPVEAFEGDSVFFYAEAFCGPHLDISPDSYQWQVSVGGGTWTDISGETDVTLTLDVTLSMNENAYRLTATTGASTIISDGAELIVNALCEPSQIIISTETISTRTEITTRTFYHGSWLNRTGDLIPDANECGPVTNSYIRVSKRDYVSGITERCVEYEGYTSTYYEESYTYPDFSSCPHCHQAFIDEWGGICGSDTPEAYWGGAACHNSGYTQFGGKYCIGGTVITIT